MDGVSEQPLLSTRDVATKCGSGTTLATIQHAARSGTLRGVKQGSTWRFTEPEATAFCADYLKRKEERAGSRRSPAALWLARFRKLTGRTVALLHLVGSLITVVPAIMSDDFAPVGYVLAVVNGVFGALTFLWAKVRPSSGEAVADIGEVDPDIIGWDRVGAGDSARPSEPSAGARPESAPEPGPPLASPVRDVAGVLESFQIVALFGAVIFAAVAAPTALFDNDDDDQVIPGSVENGSNNVGDGGTDTAATHPGVSGQSAPFTSCEDWLTGAGVQVTLDSTSLSDADRQVIVCAGELGDSSGEVFFRFAPEGAQSNWADDHISGIQELEDCALTMSGSGLPGCLYVDGNPVDITVAITDDLVVQIVWGSDDDGSDLRETAERIVDHLASVTGGR